MSSISEAENPYAAPSAAAVFAENVALEGALATRGERFVGAVVDGLVLLPIVLPVSFAIGMAAAFVDTSWSPLLVEQVLTLFSSLISLVIYVAVNGYFLATRGQSLGKMLMKTKIVSEETDEILPLDRLILLRYLPLYIGSSILLVGMFVGFVNSVAILRSNRKCIHDEIAGTKVIKLGPSS